MNNLQVQHPLRNSGQFIPLWSCYFLMYSSFKAGLRIQNHLFRFQWGIYQVVFLVKVTRLDQQHWLKDFLAQFFLCIVTAGETKFETDGFSIFFKEATLILLGILLCRPMLLSLLKVEEYRNKLCFQPAQMLSKTPRHLSQDRKPKMQIQEQMYSVISGHEELDVPCCGALQYRRLGK
jgi:hypothetical protein